MRVEPEIEVCGVDGCGEGAGDDDAAEDEAEFAEIKMVHARVDQGKDLEERITGGFWSTN